MRIRAVAIGVGGAARLGRGGALEACGVVWWLTSTGTQVRRCRRMPNAEKPPTHRLELRQVDRPRLARGLPEGSCERRRLGVAEDAGP